MQEGEKQVAAEEQAAVTPAGREQPAPSLEPQQASPDEQDRAVATPSTATRDIPEEQGGAPRAKHV